MNKSKETTWSQDEINKLTLAIKLYQNLNKERCEHIHLHVLPYKSVNEILKKSNELIKEEEEFKSNNNNTKTTSPVLKSTLSPNTSPVLKSSLPSSINNNNNNNHHYKRSASPEFWSNN